METISLSTLFILLAVLIVLSAFFSCSETCMMAVNRYKLRHLAKEKKHVAARRVLKLLDRTDRLLTVVLLGNTIANIFASAVATILSVRLYGEQGIFIATICLTLVILIFSEIGPKTVAARFPQPFALLTSLPLQIFLFLLYPLVWVGNNTVRLMLWPLRATLTDSNHEYLNTDELRLIVHESRKTIPRKHQEMLVGVLDLEKMSVEDLMVPRADIVAVDIDDNWEHVIQKIINANYTHIPAYSASLDQIRGMIHQRDVLQLMMRNELTKENLLATLREPYFIPETTIITQQLINFQKHHSECALVVDEYGDLKGLLAFEDILVEIVGKFSPETSDGISSDIKSQADGSYIIDASISLRDLNRELGWRLPTSGAKTLNGLIIETLDAIPNPNTNLKMGIYLMEILKVQDNLIKFVKISVTSHGE
ncbi:MAG: HlyC/CorC family transporter [Gammaproteobacteria bacterium]|nr:HlyC/CorC family transporter [Gammaproteobacteria bacterium]